MAVSPNSEFWKKKFHKAFVMRDAEKKGYIARSDFELVIDWYKKCPTSTPEKYEIVKNVMFSFWERAGIVDPKVKLSFEEVEELWKDQVLQDLHKELFKPMFEILDANGDGHISLSEWEDYYTSLGIPTEFAQDSFRAMDTNHDEKVTMDEFIAYNIEYYHSDENKLNSAILYGPFN